MGSCCFDLIIFFLSAFLINFSLTITAQPQPQPQPPTYLYHFCQGANYTANSTYESNLKLLLTSLSSNSNTNSINTNGFYNSTVGRSPDIVYGSLQCRGDVDSPGCRACVNTATEDVKEDKCPISKQAVLFYDECTLRYSDRFFFSFMADNPAIYLSNAVNVSFPDRFIQIAAGLMSDLTTEAVSPSSVSSSNNTLFAVGDRIVTTIENIERVYGYVQCTSDLNPSLCEFCLGRIINQLPTCCNEKKGGRVITPSCNFRYENYPFVQQRANASPPPASSPAGTLPTANTTLSSNGKGNGKGSTRIALFITIPVAIVAFIFTIVIWFMCFRRKKIPKKFDTNRGIMQTSDVHLEGVSSSFSRYYEHNEERNGVDVPFVDFETILTATGNFSNSNKLGQGGFGPVYKGTFKGGKVMAVKRLSRSSGQGLKEFRNEVLLIAKLQHRNLVKLLGYCIKEEEKLLLYEYMPNKSLDSFIFDRTLCLLINWEKRLDIILGIARGILYLHQDSRLRIIHRDLKTSNILLDTEMNPKISDFGLARICGETQTEGSTNRVVGTYGYMAPEYALDGIFSVKSDVYSFGVVLLEIISGKKNSGFHVAEDFSSLIGYAWRLWNENKVFDFIDDSLCEACNDGEVLKCIQVGLLCVQEDANDRPTMFSAVFMLGGETKSIPTPKQPAFFFRRYQSSTTTSSNRLESCSKNEITISAEDGR